MKAFVYFRGSVLPDAGFDTLHGATEHMEHGRSTGIVVIIYPGTAPELIWYNQGKRK